MTRNQDLRAFDSFCARLRDFCGRFAGNLGHRILLNTCSQSHIVKMCQNWWSMHALCTQTYQILLLLLLLVRQHLLHHLCLHFHVHCCLANSSPSSSPTSELSVHRWTSTWDLPSSVGTAGPQPGTFPAQWAPLDLNLGPAQLSVHRWTSTWDLPTSVCTAGPQKHGNQF